MKCPSMQDIDLHNRRVIIREDLNDKIERYY